VDVLLVEPGPIGPGVHREDQPAYLWLNTVAAQATAFCDEHMASGGPALGGLDFLNWARRRGVDAVLGEGRSGHDVRGDDYLPRRLFGEYMRWAADETLGSAPGWVSIETAARTAVDLRPTSTGALISLDDGTRHEVDLAIVTTGHGVRRPATSAPREMWEAYPLPDTVARAASNDHVGVVGMGLTAVDVIAALTIGRGGTFSSERDLQYVRSGDEPQIVIWSTTGWLPCARPANPRLAPKPVKGMLTLDSVAARRRSCPGGRLDFWHDLMPLILDQVLSGLPHEGQRQAARNVLGVGKGRWRDAAEYSREVVEQASWDLLEARRGLGVSAFKEQMETLRDCREVFRAAVSAPGLTDQGHRDFFRYLPAMANRAAVGPQMERLEEVLALMRAGVVSLGPGASPTVTRDGSRWLVRSTSFDVESSTHVDHLVRAHLDWPRAVAGVDPLRRSIESWAAAHSADARYLDLTSEGNVRRPDGTVCPCIAVFGPPAEGANFYNNYVLWPGVPSRVVADMDRLLAPNFHRHSQLELRQRSQR
jgi:hypothetical protein